MCDETTDITNTAQLAIFVRGITAEFGTSEELLSIQAMHSTTKGEDLFKQVVLAMNKFELPFEKLSGLATDGTPAMLGTQKGLTALVKKEISCLSLNPSDLVVCHCIIHQESLCARSQAPKCNDNCRFHHKFHQKQRAKQPPIQGVIERFQVRIRISCLSL